MEVARNVVGSVISQIESCIIGCKKIIQNHENFIESHRNFIEDKKEEISFFSSLKLKFAGHDRIRIVRNKEDVAEECRDISIFYKEDGTLIVTYIHLYGEISGEREYINLDKSASVFIKNALQDKKIIYDKDVIDTVKYVCNISSGLEDEEVNRLYSLLKTNYLAFKDKCRDLDINPVDLQNVFCNLKC